jgi:hypothetical protein
LKNFGGLFSSSAFLVKDPVEDGFLSRGFDGEEKNGEESFSKSGRFFCKRRRLSLSAPKFSAEAPSGTNSMEPNKHL